MRSSRKYPSLLPTCLLIIFTLLTFTQPAHSSFIGDTITIRRLFPDLNTDFAPSVTTIVQAGNADAVSPQASLYSIDIEHSDILIDFTNTSAFGGDENVFDGIQFSGFSDIITDAFVTNSTGISVVAVTFGDDFIRFNLNGAFDSNSFLSVHAVIPEPSSASFCGIILLSIFGTRTIRIKIFNNQLNRTIL